jgi:hypothetical protein
MKTHQHVDKKGKVFGKSHPVDAIHRKEATKKAHEFTVRLKQE